MTVHKKLNGISLCQLVSSQHLPEAVLDCNQVAARLGKSPKTIRNWLRQQVECPKSFKDKNQWYVYLSDLNKWEEEQI
ncbi:hypothetical protein BCU84_19785 [Shewanella sp. 10N.286.51.B7]|uniref:helix-turn-helix domain-containing protein n=1 Tax=Shewanella sp. 10N.286.51.B7 TaxID=1880836 RepID=UPI000C85693D|nr:helix-turn-helix domain-containing protein [Shewanella sp. 10N.286.51.B7]PMG72870.1 hypothetical protein BCU84_19785 [Shewanella sp. 10N.286.51.B7]